MLTELQEFERREARLAAYQNSPEYRDAVMQRLKIADACTRSNEAKIYAVAAAKADPVFFIENFCWTPNDKYKQYHFPFILFPFQKDYIYWLNDRIDKGRDGLVDKSREMGVTWITMSLFLWKWLFNDNFNALVGSYKKELVDDRTKDSLFGVLDYNLHMIPEWMLPKRFNFDKHRTHMKLVNPENNNIIKGDTMNPEFGRGSRRSVTLMDEGAHWEYFQDAWDAAGDTTNCRITVSTPLGYNSFAILRESILQNDPEGTRRLLWQLHPLKDEEWYEYEKSRRTEDNVAQELDVSYQRSQKGRIYPEWDKVPMGKYKYDPRLPLYVSWDFGRTDDTAIIWAQVTPEGIVHIIDCYWNHGKTIDFYVPFVTGMVPSESTYYYTDRDLKIIERHKYWQRGTHFGDPAGRFRNQVNNETVISILRNNGIIINFNENWKYFEKRITEAKLLMRKLRVNENPRTKQLKVCMINSKFPEVKRGGVSTTNSQGMKPMHDQYSHLRSSFEYLALGLKDLQGKTRKVHDRIKPKEINRSGARVIGY